MASRASTAREGGDMDLKQNSARCWIYPVHVHIRMCLESIMFGVAGVPFGLVAVTSENWSLWTKFPEHPVKLIVDTKLVISGHIQQYYHRACRSM